MYCEPLKENLIKGINQRFKNILDIRSIDSKPYVIAALSHPKFANKWVENEAENIFIKNLFVEECQKTLPRQDERASDGSFDIDDFFKFSNRKSESLGGIS